MLRSLGDASDFHGRSHLILLEPAEVGIDNVALTAGNSVFSRELYTAGFGHFQVGFETTVSTTIRVDVARGVPYSGRERSRFIAGGNISTAAGRHHAVYFGLASALTEAGESWRFARVFAFSLFMPGGSPASNVTAWFEMMG